MNKYKKNLTIFMAISLFLLTACSEKNNDSKPPVSQALISEKEINESITPDVNITPDTDIQKPDQEPDIEDPDPIIGTWSNKRSIKRVTYTEIEEWTTLYKTCFSPQGQIVHYGNRNVDKGTWVRIDENTVTAYFDDCTYTGIGSFVHETLPYQVTYTYDAEQRTLSRETDRGNKLVREVNRNGQTVILTATDFDTYDQPLNYDSDECTISDSYFCYPEQTEYCTALEKGLLSLAADMQAGKEVELERADLPYQLINVSTYDLTGDGNPEIFAYVEMCHSFDNSGALYVLSKKSDGEYTILAKNTDFRGGYTDLLAPDGTELLSISDYRSSSSWKGGVRIHLGYRENQVVVDREESYDFHWDYPLINYINDYKNGKYYVYVSRENDTGGAGYGSYVGIEQSLKIDEETFSPLFLPFTGYDSRETDFPAVYSLWHPFDEEWWQDGGSYPEDEEHYGRTADWIITAANDHPDEMLQEAVEKSGLKLEKKAYPWTAETKKNVTDLLRCPAADYYYLSDYYAAAYIRGEICFYEKEILPDGYGEEWILMR